MQPPQTSLKIEDLKARVRADAKSRHFYPLAEELRKIGRLDEAEQTLRTGLLTHPTYLSAWISLGKVLRDGDKKADACDTFLRALAIDPGNVVAARLAADNYLELGEKVEAIKKYKLVHALMPSDEEVEAIIDQLDRELNPQKYSSAPHSDLKPALVAEPDQPTPVVQAEPVSQAELPESPFGIEDAEEPASTDATDATGSDLFADQSEPGSSEPGAPFTLTGLDSGATEAVDVDEMSQGMSVFDSPDLTAAESSFDDQSEGLVAESAAPGVLSSSTGGESVWDDSELPPAIQEESALLVEAPPTGDGGLATVTIGDLYAQQGHHEAAREIYARVVEREPGNESAVERLRALEPTGNAGKVARLQRWLEKVGRRESASV